MSARSYRRAPRTLRRPSRSRRREAERRASAIAPLSRRVLAALASVSPSQWRPVVRVWLLRKKFPAVAHRLLGTCTSRERLANVTLGDIATGTAHAPMTYEFSRPHLPPSPAMNAGPSSLTVCPYQRSATPRTPRSALPSSFQGSRRCRCIRLRSDNGARSTRAVPRPGLPLACTPSP